MHLYSKLSLILPFFFLAFLSNALAAARHTITLAPSWIAPQTYAPNVTEAGYSTAYLLLDLQMRVQGASVERYYHHTKKVVTTAGLEEVSQLDFDFEPSYQKLLLHYIYIRRGVQTINALATSEIKTIPREEERHEQIFNGTLTTIVILNDLRVGDILDFAYSINGENPILGGKFDKTITLATSVPVAKLHRRLLYPTARALHLKNQNTTSQPVTKAVAEWQEYVWEGSNIGAITEENSTPGWFFPTPYVHLSEFGSWEEVRNWAIPLYQVKAPLSAALQKQIAQWRAMYATPEEQFIAALRFVQDEIRYLGIELGPHSHLPHDPSLVFAKRFGDCKDKVLLLTTILHALNIEAAPALVHTASKRMLDESQPSPYVFDHVIAQVVFNRQLYWVDATASLQRGGLKQLYNPPYERALVLQDGLQGLQEIPSNQYDQPLTQVRDTLHAESFDAPARLEVVTIYRGEDADAMRFNLSGHPLTELTKEWLNYYAHDFPTVMADGEPQVADDPVKNTITITEKYRIPEFWRDGVQYIHPESIYSQLGRPKTPQRTQPLRLAFPLHIVQTMEVYLPPGFQVEDDSDKIADEALQLDYQQVFAKNVLRLEYRFVTLQDYVAAKSMATYLATLDKALNATSIRLQKGTVKNPPNVGAAVVGLALIGAVLLIPVAALVIWQATKSKPSSKPLPPRGSAPEVAVKLSPSVRLAQHLQNYRCHCGQLFLRPEEPLREETALYDGRRLTIAQLHCDSCGHQQGLYFEQAE